MPSVSPLSLLSRRVPVAEDCSIVCRSIGRPNTSRSPERLIGEDSGAARTSSETSAREAVWPAGPFGSLFAISPKSCFTWLTGVLESAST